MLNSLFNYMERGAFFTAGGWAETGPKNMGIDTSGGQIRKWGNQYYQFGPDGRMSAVTPSQIQVGGGRIWDPSTKSYKHVAQGTRLSNVPGFTASKGWTGALVGPGLSLAMSSYFLYQGYQENGLRGAFDAGILDLSTSAAIGHFAFYQTAATGKTHLSLESAASPRTVTKARAAWTPFGRSPMLAILGYGMGAYAGGEAGQNFGGAYFGAAGAVAGSYAGAGVVNLLAKNPLGKAAFVAAAVGYMAYSPIKNAAREFVRTGYRKKQDQKGLDMAGSTAAFFTRNAVTMRQRAVQAIHKSHLNARSALGQEANFMSMPGKDYFSSSRRLGNMI